MSKTIRVTYSKSYELPGFWEKIGTEQEPMKGDTIESILDEVSKNIQAWHEKHNPDFYKQGKRTTKTDVSISIQEDKEWELIKEKLQSFEYRQDAQAYIDTTNYNRVIEAKKIINDKPLKQ